MKKLLVLVFAIALCLGVLCLGASAADGGTPEKPDGDGTAENPYQIGSAAELYWFAKTVNEGDYDANAVLTDNITINENVLNDGSLNTNSSFREWTPIGEYGTYGEKAYTGTFDGRGHTISGLYYNGSGYYVGLFGRVDSDGRVQKVNVADSYISNSYRYGNVGGVCGINYGGTITNCSFDGTVTGSVTGTYVGGVCGYNSGMITNCSNAGSVTGDSVGGVCGINNGGTITNCYNTGSVTGTYTGGVCGESNGTITNCCNTGTVKGSLDTGGVCGNNVGTITNCCNTGDVTGTSVVGGVCGYNSGDTISCYNTGSVTGSETSTFVGGVCGRNGGTITSCYWLSNTATRGIGMGSNTATNDEDKTTGEFASGEVAWLLNQGQANGPWRQNLSSGEDADEYPVLDAAKTDTIVHKNSTGYENSVHYFGGNGICIKNDCSACQPATLDGDVYKISSVGQLYWFAQLVNEGDYDAHAELTNDITINENVLNDGSLNTNSSFREWTPIGTNPNSAYTGTFDGNDFTISGLYYNGSGKYVGLFGYVGSGGQVKNVNIVDSSLNSSNWMVSVGGVCGYNNEGTITNCSFAGTVTGSVTGTYVGGVCGCNYNGTITNCCNTGSVTGTGNVGGVCGNNDRGTITNCCNTGSVTGTGNVGGVCGRNGGTITNCYWLSDTASGDTSAKTTGEFASGEVAWLLNQGQTNGPWRQNLSGDADTSPVLDSTHEEVVKLTVDGAVSYLNKGDSFTGVEGVGYYLDGEMVELPYTVEADTVLTTKTLYVVTVDGVVSYVDPNEPVFKLPDAPGRSGYSFVGWSDGSKTYEAGESVTVTADMTFTAMWLAINIPGTNAITVADPSNGTVKVNPANGSEGTLITVTATPDEGYELAYITVDGEKISGSTFRMPDKTVTVSALFVPVSFPFTDVKSGDWFYDAVAYVYANGLMDGTSATTFEPNANMTRAMVWAILARIDGETVTGADWASAARTWAMASGVSDGTDPNGHVTREQFATMLYRYAAAKGYDVSIGESTNILSYADFASISEYAIPAMQWACGSGIVTGVTESTLVPQGTATRAQCAAMLMRFIEGVK
ncbi:MAG: S-layer homology domain-containing protein [Firmicutes bacterium]|nr:S-layer homology domain-containing protein [Bacillota bacterium]